MVGLCLGLLGCPITLDRVSINRPIKEDEVRFIVPGQTTLAEVVEKLGTPDQIEAGGDGPMARYRFQDGRYFRVNFLWWLRFVFPVVNFVPGASPSMNLSGGGVGMDEFQVIFNEKWVARQYAFAHHIQASRFTAWPSNP
jgi:hypothetical protein